jgi:predicted cobalt transporter CbtA
MMKFGLRGLLLLLAVVLFIVGALSDSSNREDLLFWGLAVFAASFVAESIPLGSMMAGRTRG